MSMQLCCAQTGASMRIQSREADTNQETHFNMAAAISSLRKVASTNSSPVERQAVAFHNAWDSLLQRPYVTSMQHTPVPIISTSPASSHQISDPYLRRTSVLGAQSSGEGCFLSIRNEPTRAVLKPSPPVVDPFVCMAWDRLISLRSAAMQRAPWIVRFAPVLNKYDNPPCNTLFMGNLGYGGHFEEQEKLTLLLSTQPGFNQMKFVPNPEQVSCLTRMPHGAVWHMLASRFTTPPETRRNQHNYIHV